MSFSYTYGLLLVFCVCSVSPWEIRISKGVPPELRNGLIVQARLEERFNLVFPGTKWCGSGNIAGDYNDLGVLESTDVCCRDHDNCMDVLEAGESGHGLTNNALYSRLSCECDEKFLDCLRQAARDNSKAAYLIGLIYFDALNTQCFREDYPITGCAEYYPLTSRCREYEFDTSGDKQYQWFDVPLF